MARNPLRDTRDILLVDQRGTGRSNGLFCGPEPTAPAAEFMPTLDTARARWCANELSSRADLRYYLTPYAMDDLDDLRAAFDYDELNLVGTSYGTRAALVYLRRHGDHVRSVTLQGSTAMSHPMPAGFAEGAEDALDGVIRDCAADSACAATFPDLRRDFQHAVSAIEAGPREYSVRDPRDDSSATVQLTARDFAEALRAMLYAPASARLIPLLLHHAATTGDYQLFAQFQLRRNIGLTQGLAQGMYLAVTCTEDVARTDTAAAYGAGHNTFLADHRARAHIDSCRGWPRGKLPAGYGEEVTSEVPVLIVTGEYDPATPPSDAHAAASRLSNARVVIVPRGGHSAAGLTGAACVRRLTTEFVETADPDGLDTACLADMHRPPFAVSEDEMPGR
jgi:pimeloyl-ACP methyl ester carboxylesterase